MLTKKESPKNEVKSSKTAKSTSTTTTPEANQAPVVKPHQPLTKTTIPTKTRITIQYDVGYPNQFYIRGKGANLSWDKGQPLKNVKPDEWIWETDVHFTQCEFKILINDHVYENGDNHHLNAGSHLVYTPYFY